MLHHSIRNIPVKNLWEYRPLLVTHWAMWATCVWISSCNPSLSIRRYRGGGGGGGGGALLNAHPLLNWVTQLAKHSTFGTTTINGNPVTGKTTSLYWDSSLPVTVSWPRWRVFSPVVVCCREATFSQRVCEYILNWKYMDLSAGNWNKTRKLYQSFHFQRIPCVFYHI